MHFCVGEVDGVDDIALLQICGQLIRSHHSAVVLALRSRCTQVGDRNDILYADGIGVGEVGHIASDLAGFQCCDHVSIVDQLASCEVQHSCAVLHLGNGSSVDKALGVCIAGNVQGQIICRSQYLIRRLGNLYCRGQTECSPNGQERVCADDLHAQVNGNVCNQCADGAQTDDTQGLALDLRPCELALAFLHQLAYVVALLLEGGNPCHSLGDLPGGQQQSCDYQLLYSVCVCAGGVEYNNALLCALVNGDIVHTGTCTGNGKQIAAEFHIMHSGGTNHDCIRILRCVSNGILCSVQAAGAYLGNFIECLNLKHDNPPVSVYP